MKALLNAGLNPFTDTFQQPPAKQAEAPPDDYSSLKTWQRTAMQGRLVIVREAERQSERLGVSLRVVIDEFIARLNAGQLPAHLTRAAQAANGRKGKTRSLSAKTIYRWHQQWQAGGDIGLAPADPSAPRRDEIPPWAPAFLDVYRRPQKPTIAGALREMGPDAPPYHAVVRFMKKFSNIDILRGRMSGSELRAHKAYTKRDFSELLPCDIYVCDGHSFKAYVAHPVHGRRFLPEVEAVLDVATRACIGWSTGLSESGQVVADALRHAVTVTGGKPLGGLFAIVYADRGAGNVAKMNSDEVTGIVARCGGTIKFGKAGNPQARGIVERFNETVWLPSAKRLVTYNGKDMDALSQRRTLKIIDRDIKEHGLSRMLPSWSQFIDFLAASVEEYNNRPHSSLPRIVVRGERRHMTPMERWRSFMDEGFQPDTLNDEEIRDLFRPQIGCVTRRGLVTVFGNQYFNSILEHHHGERVLVNYDIHDPKTVWVRNMQQQLICEAEWNGNRRAFYPIPVVEQARQKRKDRRRNLKLAQIREIDEEAKGVVETSIPESAIMPPAHPVISDSGFIPEPQKEMDLSPEGRGNNGNGKRPIFPDNVSRYEWHQEHGIKTEEDRAWIAWFQTTEEWRMLYE